MSDATNPTGGGPSPDEKEQAEQYARQLRSAPADQVLAEVLSLLLNAAQVKLGRHDARLMIDASAVLLEHVRPHADANLAKQVDDALGQLRIGQVQAEKAVAAKDVPEPNDLSRAPAPPSGAAAPGSAPSQPTQPSQRAEPAQPAPPRQPTQQRSPASKLWVPGRGF